MQYVIKISFINPAKWANPAPFLYTEEYGDPVTFETEGAALVMAYLMFGKNRDVTTGVINYEEAN